MTTNTFTFTTTHSITFLSDNLRNVVREVIRENGLNPDNLMQSWTTIERGIRTWIDSKHLRLVAIEFYRPSSPTVADARWDFPVGYTSSGAIDDMWLDKAYLRQLIAKAKRPAADCSYQVVISNSPGAADVDGFVSCSFRSTGDMTARSAGTIVAAAQLTASASYWK